MENYLNIFDTLKDIITLATPFVLAWFAYITSKKEKNALEYRQAREEIEAERDALLKEKEEKKSKDLSDMSNNILLLDRKINNHIEIFTDKMKDIEDEMSDFDKSIKHGNINLQINKLLSITELMLKYIMAINDIVTSLGYSVEKSDPSIKESLKNYTSLQKDFISNMYKINY